MKAIFIFFLIIIGFSSNAFAEYKNGWDYINFYKSINECRESIVFSQIKGYESRGKEKNHNEIKLQNEMISITPIVDKVATDKCFCTFNEIAKDNTFAEYKKGINLEGYMITSRCKKIMEKSFNSMNDTFVDLQLN